VGRTLVSPLGKERRVGQTLPAGQVQSDSQVPLWELCTLSLQEALTSGFLCCLASFLILVQKVAFVQLSLDFSDFFLKVQATAVTSDFWAEEPTLKCWRT
jgi:hypothetical protein